MEFLNIRLDLALSGLERSNSSLPILNANMMEMGPDTAMTCVKMK